MLHSTERGGGEKEDIGGRRISAVNIDEQMHGGIYNLNKLCLDALVDLIEEIDESHYADGEKRYKCLVCKMVSKYKRHVLTHIKNVHGKSKKYFCQICDYFHPSPNQIKTHFEDVHVVEHTIEDIVERMTLPKEKSGKSYRIPPALSFEIALKEDLPIQTKILQGGISSYQCPYCSFTRKFRNVMILHINGFHKMTKWYKVRTVN